MHEIVGHVALASPLFDALLRRRVAFDAEADLFEAPVDQHLLGDLSVLDVLGEARQLARHDCIQALAFFLAQRRIIFVPVDDVFVVQND